MITLSNDPGRDGRNCVVQKKKSPQQVTPLSNDPIYLSKVAAALRSSRLLDAGNGNVAVLATAGDGLGPGGHVFFATPADDALCALALDSIHARFKSHD